MPKKQSTSSTKITDDEKTLAVMVHLSGFLGFVIPFANIIAPLAIYLTKKNVSNFVSSHAKSVLNFQISLLIYTILGFLAVFVLVGIPILILLFILSIIWMVKGAIAASEKSPFTYPYTMKFF